MSSLEYLLIVFKRVIPTANFMRILDMNIINISTIYITSRRIS